MDTVIFDLDGVIIDSERIYKAIERDLYRQVGISMSYEESLTSMGRGIFNWWRDLKGRYDFKESAEEMAELEARLYMEFLHDDSREKRIMPGVEDNLRWLRDEGFHLALASGSNREAVEQAMVLTGFGDYFPVRISAEDLTDGKPNPEIFLKAAAALGSDPANCLVVEDAANGIAAAKAAGMACIAYTSAPAGFVDYSQADAIMDDHAELRTLMAQLD